MMTKKELLAKVDHFGPIVWDRYYGDDDDLQYNHELSRPYLALMFAKGQAQKGNLAPLKKLYPKIAACSVIAEQMESELANGKPINIAEHSQLSSTLTRLASRIGIDRRAHDITPPSVESYLAHVAKQREAAE